MAQVFGKAPCARYRAEKTEFGLGVTLKLEKPHEQHDSGKSSHRRAELRFLWSEDSASAQGSNPPFFSGDSVPQMATTSQ